MQSQENAVVTSQHREKTGQKLIKFAWGVEFIAAATGLLIAGLVALSTYQDIAKEGDAISHAYLSTFLGALPFIMVAVVEICKIPLATAFFHTSQRVWKSIFLIGLLLLMCITFETVMNGFERNFTQRTYLITKVKKELNSTTESITRISSEIETLSQLTEDKILTAYNAARKNIEEERNAKLSEIDKSISQLQESKATAQGELLSKEVATLDSKIEKLESKKLEKEGILRKSHQASAKGVSTRVTSRINKLEEQVADFQNKILQLNLQEKQEKDESFFETFTGSVGEKFELQREEIRKKISKLEAEKSELLLQQSTGIAKKELQQDLNNLSNEYDRKISKLVEHRNSLQRQLRSFLSKNDKTLQPRIDGLNLQRKDVLAASEGRLKQEQERYESQKRTLGQREQEIASLQKQIALLKANQGQLRDKINELAQDSQIYRVAALWYGKDSPADVTNDELRYVTFVWFGSLAAITAWTGTLLAFAGLALQFPRRNKAQTTPSSLLRSLRMLAVDTRRRVRAPKIKYVEIPVEKLVERKVEVFVDNPVLKEVIREVPVDRVVFKEVPKEIVKKEYVYVPVVTDDPDAIKKALAKHSMPITWSLFKNAKRNGSDKNVSEDVDFAYSSENYGNG